MVGFGVARVRGGRERGTEQVSVGSGRAGSPGADDVSRAVALLAARLPATLRPLARVAYNYRWSWAERGPELFQRIDPYRWELAGENPVRLLSDAPDPIMDRAARDDELIDGAWRMDSMLTRELAKPPADNGLSPARPVAFLCAEFGVHARSRSTRAAWASWRATS